MSWTIEKRKRSTEIFVTNNTTHDIFIGEGYNKKEYKRSMELAKVIVKALNDYEKRNVDITTDQPYDMSGVTHPYL
jgi:hypothetical protein